MKKMGFKTKIITVFLLSLLIMLFVVGCQETSEDQTGDQVVKTLKIGSLVLDENLPILVAQQKGYFEEHDLQVELLTLQSPVELQSTFQSGELDGMITDIMIALMLKGSGEDLRITSISLGATAQEGPFAIMIPSDSELKTVQDLKGKTVGISSNSIIEYVLDQILIQSGMNPEDVQKTTVAKIPVRIEMLLNNQIDAIIVPEPHISYMLAKGAKVLSDDTTKENISQSVIVMTQNALNDKSDDITCFYEAYTQAVQDINNDPEQYKGLMVESLNISDETSEVYQVQSYSEPQLPTEKNVNDIVTWLQEKGLLQNEINYQDIISLNLW